VADIEGGRKTRSGSRGDEMLLNGLMAAWSTPRASDGEKGGPNMSFGAGGQPLPAQMHQSTWVTPSARDWKDTPGMAIEQDGRSRLDQLPRQMAHFGETPTGSSAPTEKRGAHRGSPNAIFAAWLMGWPEDLILSASMALKTRSITRSLSSRSKAASTSGVSSETA
jgi:hypothetical protein